MNLTQYTTETSVARDPARWEVVVKKLKSGEMPPAPLPRPDSVQLQAAVSWIERELDRLDSLARRDPGRVTARRLNRSEYNYTVKDLLGVDFRPADDFPQDDTGYGFDTIGDVLSLSVVQMEKYLSRGRDGGANRCLRAAGFEADDGPVSAAAAGGDREILTTCSSTRIHGCRSPTTMSPASACRTRFT